MYTNIYIYTFTLYIHVIYTHIYIYIYLIYHIYICLYTYTCNVYIHALDFTNWHRKLEILLHWPSRDGYLYEKSTFCFSRWFSHDEPCISTIYIYTYIYTYIYICKLYLYMYVYIYIHVYTGFLVAAIDWGFLIFFWPIWSYQSQRTSPCFTCRHVRGLVASSTWVICSRAAADFTIPGWHAQLMIRIVTISYNKNNQ